MTVLVVVGVLVAGLAAGVLSALLGVGGGILLVPFMVLVLDFDQTLAEGTSLLVIIPTAMAGVASHLTRGYVSMRIGAQLGLGGVLGGAAGAALALVVAPELLQFLFGILVLAVGLQMMITGLRQRRASQRSR